VCGHGKARSVKEIGRWAELPGADGRDQGLKRQAVSTDAGAPKRGSKVITAT